MGREYPADIVIQAEELYCVDRLTFAAVADKLDIAASTLKRWAARYDWQQKRDDIQRARSEIRTNLIELRAKQIKHCINSMGNKGHALNVFAAAKLEELALAAQKQALEEEQLKAEPASLPDLSTPEQASQALTRAIIDKTAAMLAAPEKIDLKNLQALKNALDLVTQEEAESKGKAPVSANVRHKIQEALGLL